MNLRFLLIIVPMLLLSGCELFSGEEPLLDARPGIALVNTVHAYPTWSSDGEWIAFVKIPDTFQEDTLQNGIYKVRPDGRDKTFVSELIPRNLSWSPDGNWFVFNYGAQLAKLEIQTDSLTMLTNMGRNFFPRWSPNGEYIVYDSDVNSENGFKYIWKMNKEGEEKTRLVYTPEQGEARTPSWGKDYIYYKQFSQDYIHGELFRMNPDGSNKTQLTFDEFRDYDLHVSPYTNDMLVVRDFRIWSMDGEAENARVLTERAEMARYPAWSPDGQQIVYTNTDLNNGYLWIMNKDGSGKRQLTFPN